MQDQPNAINSPDALVEGLVRTRYTLDVCVICGHERAHNPQQETCCPECGASARRSFALFRGPREEQR